MEHYTKALEEGKSELGKLNIFSAQIPNKEDGLRTFVIDISDVVSFLPQFAEKIRQAVAEDDVEWAEGKKKENILVAENEYSRGMQFGVSATLTEIITHKREQLTKE